MFTGITQNLAVIEEIKKSTLPNDGHSETISDKGNHHTEITLRLPDLKNIKIGDSISINGVCLTVASLRNTRATFQVIDETIKKTNLIDLRKGDRVNIERSLMIGDRLDGHFVLGHIDGIGTIKKIEKGRKGSKIKIGIANKKLLPLIAQKGSIAIDGVSLTVVNVKNSTVEIALIPHTLENTTLGLKQVDDTVNIEVDILSRYLSNIYQFSGNNKQNSKIY
ncbi:MAG TPA: riboflavin synthase [Candidatus Nitrosocosmicus sp.]|nr:riboflavin synthase [Candidatus Nitrosocosmicus sp.]